MIAKAKTRKVTIKARVYRAATGQWEDLGVIYSSKSRIKNIINKIKTWLQF